MIILSLDWRLFSLQLTNNQCLVTCDCLRQWDWLAFFVLNQYTDLPHQHFAVSSVTINYQVSHFKINDFQSEKKSRSLVVPTIYIHMGDGSLLFYIDISYQSSIICSKICMHLIFICYKVTEAMNCK